MAFYARTLRKSLSVLTILIASADINGKYINNREERDKSQGSIKLVARDFYSQQLLYALRILPMI